MLTSIGNRTLSVHAPRSRPVLCKAPVALKLWSYATPSRQSLQARSVLAVLRAAASDEAAVTEQTAEDTTTPTTTATDDSSTGIDDSSTDKPAGLDSKQGRNNKQQQRRPRNDSATRDSSRSSASKDSRMQANTLYVQNLAWATLSEDLQDAFRSCQGFEDAFIMMNKNDRPAGYGFVRFSSEAAAAAAEEAMNGIELDGRNIKVRFARSGRTDAPSDSSSSSSRNNAESATGSRRVRSAASADGKFDAASDTETRVVVSNLPEGFTYREVFGMCSLFGGVKKVVVNSKRSSGKAVAGVEGGQEGDEQVEQDAAAVGDAAAAEDEEESGSSSNSSAQQQQEVRKQGGAAVAMMVDRAAAERAVEELHQRVVQGSTIRANLFRPRASKKAATAA